MASVSILEVRPDGFVKACGSNALWSDLTGTRHRPPEESGRTAQRVRFASRSNTKTPHSRYGERREDRKVRVKLFDPQEH
jgi:hypothetical protein